MIAGFKNRIPKCTTSVTNATMIIKSLRFESSSAHVYLQVCPDRAMTARRHGSFCYSSLGECFDLDCCPKGSFGVNL